jgi:heme/copper-type cytochrome/quinol oxidase subunit 4
MVIITGSDCSLVVVVIVMALAVAEAVVPLVKFMCWILADEIFRQKFKSE